MAARSAFRERRERVSFEITNCLTVTYLKSEEMLRILRELRDIVTLSDDIHSFSTSLPRPRFKAVLFLSKSGYYCPLFVSLCRGRVAKLHFPQPPQTVQEITFGWSSSGCFTYQLSETVSDHPRPLVCRPIVLESSLLVVPPFFCTLPSPTNDVNEHAQDYEDFDW